MLLKQTHDDGSTGSALRALAEHAPTLLILLKQQIGEMDKL